MRSLSFKTATRGSRLPRVAVLNESERIALLTQALGVSRQKMGQLSLSLVEQTPPMPKELEARWPKAAFLVAMAPGSVWATKRWPAQKYADLAKQLLKVPSLELVLLGSPVIPTAQALN